jgi:hypothetical protein
MINLMNIVISEVKIDFIKPNEGLVAFASVIIDNSIYLSSIAIYKKLNAQGYRILYPITKEASNLIEEAIFNKLEDVMSKVYDGYDNDNNSDR